MLNGTEYALLANEAFAANAESIPFPDVNTLGEGTDWQDEVFKDAFVLSSDFTINKGTDKSSYSFGASHLTQDGIVGASKANFERTTLKFNFDTEILKKLNLKF